MDRWCWIRQLMALGGQKLAERGVGECHLFTESPRFATRLAGLRRVRLDLKTVQTNIVIFHMAEDAPDAASIAARAKEAGILVSVFGQRKLRAVTHLDVDENSCVRAADILARVIERS